MSPTTLGLVFLSWDAVKNGCRRGPQTGGERELLARLHAHRVPLGEPRRAADLVPKQPIR